MERVAWSTVVFASLLAMPCAAAAQSGNEAGGVYGRFDGDMVLSAEALGTFADTSTGGAGALSVAARVRFLDMTGVVVGYDRAFAAQRHDALWAGVDFRPAWLARLNYDMQHGPRWLDLALDSIGIEMGVAWLQPGEPLRGGSGFGFMLGGGVEFPLVWSRGNGVLLRLATRWITSRPWDAQGTGAADGLFEAGVGLVFRGLFRTGSVGHHD